MVHIVKFEVKKVKKSLERSETIPLFTRGLVEPRPNVGQVVAVSSTSAAVCTFYFEIRKILAVCTSM